MNLPQHLCFLWSFNNTFSKRDKFTILLIVFKCYCVKVNATYRCRQKLLHHFNYNKITTTTTKWKGWKKTKQLLFPFNYNTNTNTTTNKWKGWENRKFLCPSNYYINTITIKKWKFIKITFLEVYCKPKHDAKTLKTHMAITLICKNTWTQRMTN